MTVFHMLDSSAINPVKGGFGSLIAFSRVLTCHSAAKNPRSIACDWHSPVISRPAG